MGYKVQCCNNLWDISSHYDCYDRRNQFSYGRFDHYDRDRRILGMSAIVIAVIATIVEQNDSHLIAGIAGRIFQRS